MTFYGYGIFPCFRPITIDFNMAAARVVHVACSEYPGMVNTLRKQLLGSAELNALVTVKSVDPNG